MREMRAKNSLRWVRGASDYRVLRAKRDQFGMQFNEHDQARLSELSGLFALDAGGPRSPWSQRERYRAPIACPVRFGDVIGQAHDISADGIFVITNCPLPVGARTVLHISERPEPLGDDEEQGPFHEWQFAAEVIRVDTFGMGLRFLGIPVVLSIVHASLQREAVQRAA